MQGFLAKLHNQTNAHQVSGSSPQHSETQDICYWNVSQKLSKADNDFDPSGSVRTVYFIHWLTLNWLRYKDITGLQQWFDSYGQHSLESFVHKCTPALYLREPTQAYQKLKRSLKTDLNWLSYIDFEVWFRAGLLFLSGTGHNQGRRMSGLVILVCTMI